MERWAAFVSQHPWRVIAGWLLLSVVLIVAAQTYGGVLTDSFNLPNSESQRAQELLSDIFPEQSGTEVRAVFHNLNGSATDPAVMNAIAAFRHGAAAVEDVNQVTNPYQTPADISRDRQTALVRVRYGKFGRELEHSSVQELVDLGEAAQSETLIVEFSGPPIRELETQETRVAELVGIGVALIVLVTAFGSILAAGLPIITALIALGLGSALILLAATVLDIVTFAPLFGAMLGIGVGIDYALFVISRFREQLAVGQPIPVAVQLSLTTAGRAVAFAGIIVVIALLGLFFIGIPLIANLGLSATLVVLLEMLIAISLLPALLQLVGRRIDALSIPGLRYTSGGERGRWYRFSRRIERRPLLWLIGAAALLIACAAPLLDIELGVGDDSGLPERYTSRRAHDLISSAFGPGVNAGLFAVTEQSSRPTPQELANIRTALAALDNVAFVAPPQLNASGTSAVFTVIPTSAPQDQATRDLVHLLRNNAVPAATASTTTNMSIYITGLNALTEDVTQRMLDRLPIFFAVVIGLSILLLMMAFRSILVPLKAALMNMLAISASIGVVVAGFQWGWLLDIVGLDQTGPVESFLPMFMFAILFGLSMDYEVFLLSRVRERWLQTGDSAESVAHGIGASARVITAAAAILAAVFLSFAIFGTERAVKEFGIGMAFAIIVDATVVRLVLVPAFMQLAGRANWWMPHWLDRFLPNISIDPPIGSRPPLPALPATRREPVWPPSEPQPAPTIERHPKPSTKPAPLWGATAEAHPQTFPTGAALAPPAAPSATHTAPAAIPALPAAPDQHWNSQPNFSELLAWAALGSFTACAFIIGLRLGADEARARFSPRR